MSTAATARVVPPPQGASIATHDGKLVVPDNPIIPFIEGDGTGPDIWRASVRVMDAAVTKAYGGKRRIHWMEVFAGEKANRLFNTWLPEETVAACREYLVSIKGPLTTPVGGGIRSLNVALRQMLDLYVCLRPVRWFKGVPSPVKHPEKVDMVIFRENTEDIYAGIEFEQGSAENQKFLELFRQAFPKAYAKIRFPESSGIGIKPVSKQGSERLIRAALSYAVANRRTQPDAGAQGQHPEVHRGGVPQLGLPARRARVRRAVLQLGAVGAHPSGQGRAAGQRRDGRGEESRARHRQGRDRRHHAAAGADPPGGIRRHRHDRISTATTCRMRSPPRSVASASPPAATSTTSPGTRCSKQRTAPRRSTPTSTRSTPAR